MESLPGRRRFLVKLGVAGLPWLGAVLPGCQASKWMLPQLGSTPCQLPRDITRTELVALLNQRTSQLIAWRSTDVKINSRDIPVSLSASVSVESPRNFRLQARSLTGEEADFGSNQDRFWFWMKRSPQPYVFFARHEDMPLIGSRLPLPFQPDWLMEVLGVIPLDGSAMTLQRSSESPEVIRLVSERTSPAGRPVRRVIEVETCYGHIVAHELYDRSGQLIARASLSDYRTDEETGLPLPHHIALEWPQAQLDMTLRIGTIEVNPPSIPAQVWRLPDYPGSKPLNLARVAARQGSPRSRQPPGAGAFRRR